MTVETLLVTIKQDVQATLRLRVARAMEELVGEIKRAYASEFTASHGASGAIGAVGYEVKSAEQFIEATIGLADSAKYLRNLEFGERGTSGGQGLLARSKAPPVVKMYDWLRLANLKPDSDFFLNRAKRFRKDADVAEVWDRSSKPWRSGDEMAQFAFYLAMKRKKLGRPALHIIQRTAQAHSQRIKSLLQGGA